MNKYYIPLLYLALRKINYIPLLYLALSKNIMYHYYIWHYEKNIIYHYYIWHYEKNHWPQTRPLQLYQLLNYNSWNFWRGFSWDTNFFSTDRGQTDRLTDRIHCSHRGQTGSGLKNVIQSNIQTVISASRCVFFIIRILHSFYVFFKLSNFQWLTTVLGNYRKFCGYTFFGSSLTIVFRCPNFSLSET